MCINPFQNTRGYKLKLKNMTQVLYGNLGLEISKIARFPCQFSTNFQLYRVETRKRSKSVVSTFQPTEIIVFLDLFLF